MDTSRRAVESYWRSKMIDAATSDEDKVTPVYKLDEICELLRSSHVSIVKEVSEFIFKRLQHKSPIVKQKALRVIKYAVGKSGANFKREMQRNSVAIRQLIHHKGQPDPLKGDALNKSVRETAQEALSALFSGEDTSKPPPNEGLTQRIQGFGNTNFDPQSDDKKSFLNNTENYKSPNIRRSLTNESSYSGTLTSARLSTEVSGPWGQEIKASQANVSSSGSGSGSGLGSGSRSFGVKSREERLLETIVTSGGIRLQPTRDALQVFLSEALKLDSLALSQALEAKLQSHMWQVCVRGLCVLEAILRKKDDENFLIIASYFTKHINVVIKCSQSPQASAREKANKVLSLLTGDKNLEPEKPIIQMPDLIDTNLMDDLYGDSVNDDPFADVSFHGQNNIEQHESVDIFSGLATIDKSSQSQSQSQPELLDLFGSEENVKDLLAGLSINEDKNGLAQDSTTNLNPQMNDVISNMLQFQGHGTSQNPMFPMGPSTYNTMMLNPMLFGSQQINYAAMSNLLAQQQFLSTMNSSSAFPDIFNPVIASQTPTSTMSSSKKDDTKAFDFISDHLAAARDPKRVN